MHFLMDTNTTKTGTLQPIKANLHDGAWPVRLAGCGGKTRSRPDGGALCILAHRLGVQPHPQGLRACVPGALCLYSQRTITLGLDSCY